MPGTVRSEVVDEGVTLLTLDRPSRLNAMSVELVADLHAALDDVAADRACRVVVLTGAGRGFCAGLDLKGIGINPASEGLGRAPAGLTTQQHIATLVPHLRSLRQPVIAAVNGPAYGGGMCLALAADLRFAGASATFNSTGIVNGLTSTELGVSWLLPRLIGVARSNDLLLTGRVVDAAEALGMGLVSRVLPDDELLPAALDVAEAMCRYSPYGLAMTKDVIWANLEVGSLEAAIELEDRNQLMLGFTENLPTAIRAFEDGSAPVYTDEPRRGMFPE
jgi:enoyl-CoA hydratase